MIFHIIAITSRNRKSKPPKSSDPFLSLEEKTHISLYRVCVRVWVLLQYQISGMNISLLIWDCFQFSHEVPFYLEISIKTLVPGGFLFGIEKSGSFENPSFGSCFNLRCFSCLMCGCGFFVDIFSCNYAVTMLRM